jgi:hypothetical protein
MLTDQEKLWFHAGESYARLAARTGADPVALAEADVLGKLYDAMDKTMVDYIQSRNGMEFARKFGKRYDSIREIVHAIAACRQPKDQP